MQPVPKRGRDDSGGADGGQAPSKRRTPLAPSDNAFAVPAPRISSSGRLSVSIKSEGSPEHAPSPSFAAYRPSPSASRSNGDLQTTFRYTPLRTVLVNPPRRFVQHDPRVQSSSMDFDSVRKRKSRDPVPLLIGRIASHPVCGLVLTDTRPTASYETNGSLSISERPLAVRIVLGFCSLDCWDFTSDGMLGRLVYIAAWNWVPSVVYAGGSSQGANPEDPAGLSDEGHIEALLPPRPILEGHFLDSLAKYDFAQSEFDPLEAVESTEFDKDDQEVEALLPQTTSQKLEEFAASQLNSSSQIEDGTFSQSLFAERLQSLLGRKQKSDLSVHGRVVSKSSIYWVAKTDGDGALNQKRTIRETELPWFFCRLGFGLNGDSEFSVLVVVQTSDPIALHMALEHDKWYIFTNLRAVKVMKGKALVWKGGAIRQIKPRLHATGSDMDFAKQSQLSYHLCAVDSQFPSSNDGYSTHFAFAPVLTYTGSLTSRPHPQLLVLDGTFPLFLVHRFRTTDVILESARLGSSIECRGVHAVRTPFGIALVGCAYSSFRLVSFPGKRAGLPGCEGLGDWKGICRVLPLSALTGIPGMVQAAAILSKLESKFPGAVFLPDGADKLPESLISLLKLLGLKDNGRSGILEYLDHDGVCHAVGDGFQPTVVLNISSLFAIVQETDVVSGGCSGSQEGLVADAEPDHQNTNQVRPLELNQAEVSEQVGSISWLVGELLVDKAGRIVLGDSSGVIPLILFGGTLESSWIGAIFAIRNWTVVLDEAVYVRCCAEDLVCILRSNRVDPGESLTNSIAAARDSRIPPRESAPADWILSPSDIKPVTMMPVKSSDRIKPLPSCRVEGLAVRLSPDLDAKPTLFRWDLRGENIRHRPLFKSGHMTLATRLCLHPTTAAGNDEMGEFLVASTAATEVHSISLDPSPATDADGRPLTSDLGFELRGRLSQLLRRLKDLAQVEQPQTSSIAGAMDLRLTAPRHSPLTKLLKLDFELGSLLGIVINKEFGPVPDPIYLRDPEALQRYGVGTGANSRALVIRLRDVDSVDTLDLFHDCSNQEWPLNVLPGWVVRVGRCAFKFASNGRRLLAQSLPGITTIEPVRFVPEAERNLVVEHAASARGILRLSNWLSPQYSNVRATASLRCRVRALRSVTLRYTCRSCHFPVFQFVCPQECDSVHYGLDAEANCSIYDGTAEAQAYFEGVESVFSLLGVRGLVSEKLRESAAKLGELAFYEDRTDRGAESGGGLKVLEAMNEIGNRGSLRGEERLLKQCCTRPEVFRELSLLVKRFYKDDSGEERTSSVKLGTTMLPVKRGPRLAFKVVQVRDVDWNADAARLLARLER